MNKNPSTPPHPPRPSLSALSIGHGKRDRLWRLLYGSGPANGTLLVLPLDAGSPLLASVEDAVRLGADKNRNRERSDCGRNVQ